MTNKIIAYMTADRKMLIFADSPNMLPDDKSGLIPLYADIELMCDRAFIHGMQIGWNYGDAGNSPGFVECIENYRKQMRECPNAKS